MLLDYQSKKANRCPARLQRLNPDRNVRSMQVFAIGCIICCISMPMQAASIPGSFGPMSKVYEEFGFLVIAGIFFPIVGFWTHHVTMSSWGNFLAAVPTIYDLTLLGTAYSVFFGARKVALWFWRSASFSLLTPILFVIESYLNPKGQVALGSVLWSVGSLCMAASAWIISPREP